MTPLTMRPCTGGLAEEERKGAVAFPSAPRDIAAGGIAHDRLRPPQQQRRMTRTKAKKQKMLAMVQIMPTIGGTRWKWWWWWGTWRPCRTEHS